MFATNATDVRKEWSSVVDSVLREKPRFIKRTRDYMFLSDIQVLEAILDAYSFTAALFVEEDGTVTLSLDQFDIVENANTEDDAIMKMASAILEYAEDYYDDFSYWARGERKSHIPYVFKALLLGDAGKIGGLLKCRHGTI